MHDIGKLGVSNEILDKPGKVDSAEWGIMKTHSKNGELILSRIAAFTDIAFVALAHHEKLDGTGYPNGLAGEQINLNTRIVTTADIYDALTADRPYRPAMDQEQAVASLRDGSALPSIQSALPRSVQLLKLTGRYRNAMWLKGGMDRCGVSPAYRPFAEQTAVVQQSALSDICR